MDIVSFLLEHMFQVCRTEVGTSFCLIFLKPLLFLRMMLDPKDFEGGGTKIVDEKTWSQKHLTTKNIIFVAVWAVFIYQCIQLPNYLQKDLASFDPVDILGVPPDASEDDIKKVLEL